MKVYRLKARQGMNCSVKEAWDFLQDPRNLKKITPESLDFNITNDPPARMYPGTIITYTVRPLFGIKATWVTEITQVNEPESFIDEQRFGPYSMWHHEHKIYEGDGETIMEDLIHYVVPFGIFGQIANSLIVKSQLRKIFAYRQKVVKELYGDAKTEVTLEII